MMKKNHITRTIIASAVLFSFNAAAATSYFEARNDAMGVDLPLYFQTPVIT
ncbi:incI1 conjugal transfer TraF domain protein [Escherichia coli]|nr:incI1 conjugal transfer TraF domain protein [Escherichia coli]